MKTLKVIDLGIQLILILATIFTLILVPKNNSIIDFFNLGFELPFVIFYFGLGSYQFITHFVKWYSGNRSKGHRLYNYCLWIVIVGSTLWISIYQLTDKTSTLWLFSYVPIFYLLTMQVVGVLMAVFYFIITVKEYSVLKKKHKADEKSE